jgi:UDP-2,3-diacylglucosamine hydrolase
VIVKNYFGILSIFSKLKESGCRLIFLSGNHDFWFNDFLKESIGMEMYTDSFIETINGKRLFVSHGDKYTNNDLRYKIISKIIRNRFVQTIFNLIHPDLSLVLGNKLSRTSSKLSRTSNKSNTWTVNGKTEQGLINTAERLSLEYDLIVFGHSHNPLKIANGESIYINCGDWLRHNSYCLFTENGVELKYNKLEDF